MLNFMICLYKSKSYIQENCIRNLVKLCAIVYFTSH